MKIGWDLDGVVYNFVEAHRQVVASHGRPLASLTPPTTYNWWAEWGLTKEEFLAFFAEGVKDGRIWLEGTPYFGAVNTMVRQREQGHTIHIVTHRNDFGAKGIRSTCEWLSRWCVPYDTLSFAKDKTSVPVDVFIEDNVDNVLALQSAGVVAVLMTRSWNENDQKAEHLLRVGSFVEFQRLVDRVQKLRDREAVPVEPRGSTEARSDIVLPDTGRGRLLAEAARITHGDRNLSYGSPTQNFTDIASVWNVQFRHKLSEGQSFVPADIARAMVGMKLVRMIAADKFDNWLDIAGYAGCGWEALEEEQAAQKTV